MHERMGRASRIIWYCWLWVAFCSARVWMSFSCSARGGQPHVFMETSYVIVVNIMIPGSLPSSSRTSGVLPVELSSVG